MQQLTRAKITNMPCGNAEKEKQWRFEVAINGFGRIGRNILRAIAESKRKDIEVVLINDLGPVETNAHLLRFDSVHGRFPGDIKVAGELDRFRRGSDQGDRDPRSARIAA